MDDFGIIVLPASYPPPFDDWVLAYWPHMTPERWNTPKTRLHGGWFLSRLRVRGWQMQTGWDHCYPVNDPLFWTYALDPDEPEGTEA